MGKRTDYILWDEYFMGIAMLSAMRSKDPSTQVGACIVDPDNRILSVGYNGMPNKCMDDAFSWDKEGEFNKYLYVVHSELNAILNARGKDLNKSKLYVTLFPCNECAKAIVQSGISTVIYMEDKYHDSISTVASRQILDAANVEYYQYKPSNRKVSLLL